MTVWAAAHNSHNNGEYYSPMNDFFDDLNPAFRDEEAFIDLETFDGEESDYPDDDFDEMLEYDDWRE